MQTHNGLLFNGASAQRTDRAPRMQAAGLATRAAGLYGRMMGTHARLRVKFTGLRTRGKLPYAVGSKTKSKRL